MDLSHASLPKAKPHRTNLRLLDRAPRESRRAPPTPEHLHRRHPLIVDVPVRLRQDQPSRAGPLTAWRKVLFVWVQAQAAPTLGRLDLKKTKAQLDFRKGAW